MRNIVSALMACLVLSGVDARLGNAQESKWGTLKGQVFLDGAPKVKMLVEKGAAAKDAAVCGLKGIPDETFVVDQETGAFANVIIYLQKRPALVHPDLEKKKVAKDDKPKDAKEDPVKEKDNEPEEVKFDQKDCRFVPHVLLVRTDQRIRSLSDDPIAHNVHSFPLKNVQMNMIVPPNDRKGNLFTFPRAEKLPVKVSCDIHPWMSAYWVILDHPYAAITDKMGNYEIRDLPVGDHEFQVWHESSGWIEKRYRVSIAEGMNQQEPLTFAIDTDKEAGK